MTVSVLTLVRDREPQLRNLVRGLVRSHVPPDELVVAWMGGPHPASALGTTPFPHRVLDVSGDGGHLPLAAARNHAAAQATADRLVFLDVDCIPGRNLVGAYRAALGAADALVMGPVRYLPEGAAGQGWDEEHLEQAGVEHPARRVPAGGPIVPSDDYALFWSLSFAVSRRTFLDRIGGFDESFRGYGGEDTDLAFTARAAQVPLVWAPDAVAYHQDHEHYDPPLHHLDDIVANARRFRDKWGTWPMEGWLRAFADAGLITWEGGVLTVIRQPTDRELAAARRRAFPGSSGT